MRGRLLQAAVWSLDRIACILPWSRRDRRPAHLQTGQKGEEAAYFWLRQQGYTMVARNWRSPGRRGEIDLIGWEEGTLCFIEVKTRSQRGLVPAEAAVDIAKQHELRAMARDYLRRVKPRPAFRFDVVSVYCEPGESPGLTLFRKAFAASEFARD